LASEGVVAPLVVVVLEPWLQGLGACVVGGEDLPVGPFGLEGLVESFDFAVLPGAVGSDGDVFGSELCDDGGNGMALGVAVVVVGHDLVDIGDAV
jgi:hypothetical protein